MKRAFLAIMLLAVPSLCAARDTATQASPIYKQPYPVEAPADTKTIVGKLEIPYQHSLIGTVIHIQGQANLPIHPQAITADIDINKYNGHIVKMLAKVEYLRPGPDSQLREGEWITRIESIEIIE